MGGEGQGRAFGFGLGGGACSALGLGCGACSAVGSAATYCSQSHSSNPTQPPPPPISVLRPWNCLPNAPMQILHILKRTPRGHAAERPQRHGGHLSSKSTNEHPEPIRMLNIQLHIVYR